MDISLENNWLYYFAENPQVDYSQPTVDDSAWIPLPEIEDWVVTTSVQSGADWFRLHFVLFPADFCVHYVLHIEVVPENLVVYINGRMVENTGTRQNFRADVTNEVTLDENIIALRLTPQPSHVGGGLGKIRLQQVPC